MGIKKLNVESVTSAENLKPLLRENEIVVFMLDLDDYNSFETKNLSDWELAQLEKLKTKYFKKRFIISRTVLKQILRFSLNKSNIEDIVLRKDPNGKTHVLGHNEIHLCFSYTENIAFLAISKIGIGIDAEVVKKRKINNVSDIKAGNSLPDSKFANDIDVLTQWTLRESYCKFANTSICEYIRKKIDLKKINHESYLVSDQYVFSLITGDDNNSFEVVKLDGLMSFQAT